MGIIQTKQKYCICNNCGAEISYKDAKCSYCGAMNYVGAELKYFKDLNKIKSNLKDLGEVPTHIYKEEMNTQLKKILKIFVVGLSILILIIAGMKLYDKWKESSENAYFADAKEQLLWDKENFPMLNQWYEDEEYEKLLDYLEALFDTKSKFSYTNWPHTDFLWIYGDYQSAKMVMERVEDAEEYSKYERIVALGGALKITFNLEHEGLDEEELTRAKAFIPDMEKLLYEKFKFTKEEALQLYEEVTVEGYVYFDKIEKYVVDTMEQP